MSSNNHIINEATTLRDIVENSDKNTSIGISRVLVIYTGGTIGMVNTPDSGYVPEKGYLTEYLKSQSRFHDPDGFEDISVVEQEGTDSFKNSFNSGKFPKTISEKWEENYDASQNELISDWLITPKLIHNKRIKYCVKAYSPLLDSSNIDME
ncbi:hypothetical protein AYI69_g5983, partial [Smittium culicis]